MFVNVQENPFIIPAFNLQERILKMVKLNSYEIISDLTPYDQALLTHIRDNLKSLSEGIRAGEIGLNDDLIFHLMGFLSKDFSTLGDSYFIDDQMLRAAFFYTPALSDLMQAIEDKIVQSKADDEEKHSRLNFFYDYFYCLGSPFVVGLSASDKKDRNQNEKLKNPNMLYLCPLLMDTNGYTSILAMQIKTCADGLIAQVKNENYDYEKSFDLLSVIVKLYSENLFLIQQYEHSLFQRWRASMCYMPSIIKLINAQIEKIYETYQNKGEQNSKLKELLELYYTLITIHIDNGKAGPANENLQNVPVVNESKSINC